MDRILTENPELDTLLGGGFPARSLHVLMGPPGSGKTILAEQMAFAPSEDSRPVVYVTTLSEPMTKFLAFHVLRISAQGMVVESSGPP